MKEIIEGSKIASEFKRIYASSYLYSADGVAEWPAQAINYTNKTQYIFRIAKGFFEECDERVNDSMSPDRLNIPYENIVYIGDSATDIPCMRLVKSKGGYSIGVFDPEKNARSKVYQLYSDARIDLYAPADYSENGDLMLFMRQIIDAVATKESIKAEQKKLRVNADSYKMYNQAKQLLGVINDEIHPDAAKRLRKVAEEMKRHIEGNID